MKKWIAIIMSLAMFVTMLPAIAMPVQVQAAETVVPDDLHIQYDAENGVISWDAVEWGIPSSLNMYRLTFTSLETGKSCVVDTSKNQITLGEVLEDRQLNFWCGVWSAESGIYCNTTTRDIGFKGDFRIEIEVHYLEKDAITGSDERRKKKTQAYEYNLEYTLYNAMPDFVKDIRLVRDNRGNPILKWTNDGKPGGDKLYNDYAVLIHIEHEGREYYWGATSNTIGTYRMDTITRETQLDLRPLEKKLKEIGENEFGVYIFTRSMVADRGIGRIFSTHYSAAPYYKTFRLKENPMDYPVSWGDQTTEPYKVYWNLDKWRNIVDYEHHTFQLELIKNIKGADGRYRNETLCTKDITESEKSGSIDFTKEILEHGDGEYQAKITQRSSRDSRFSYYDSYMTYFYIEDYLKFKYISNGQESGTELIAYVGEPLTIGYAADDLPNWITNAGYSLKSPLVNISFDKYDGDVNLYNIKTDTPSWTQIWTPSKAFAGDRATITYSIQLVDSEGHAGPYNHISNTFYANVKEVEKTEADMPKFVVSPKDIVLKNGETIATIQWGTDKTIGDDMTMYLMTFSDDGKTISGSAAKLTDVKNDGTYNYNCRTSRSNTRYWYILDIRQSTSSGTLHSYSDPFSITWTNDGTSAGFGPVFNYRTILTNGTNYEVSIPFNFGKSYGDDGNTYRLYYLKDGVYENVAGAGYSYHINTSSNTLDLTIYSDERNLSSDMNYKMVVKNKYPSSGLLAIGSLSTEFQVRWVPEPVALTEFAVENVVDGKCGENVNAVALVAEATYADNAHYNINYGWRAHISKKIDDQFVPIDQQEGEYADYYQEKYNAGEYKVSFIVEANANGDKSNSYDFDKKNLSGTINGKKAIIEVNPALGSDSVEISYTFTVGHKYSSEWSSSELEHWHACTCGDKQDVAAHTFEWITDKPATESEKGSKHEECTVCHYKKAPVEIDISDSNAQVWAFVSRMYTVVLDRKEDTDGVRFWVKRLLDYIDDGAKIAGGFVGSEEFVAKNVSDEQYLTILYQAFFDRKPDEGGMAYWIDLINNGMDRKEVLSKFVNSKEFADICDYYGIARGTMDPDGTSIYNPGVRNYVLRMYTKCLQRSGETIGVEFWAYRINKKEVSAEFVAKEFFNSEEYINKNLNNEEYIETLYETFMDRPADSAGKAYWSELMQNGMSRNEVLEKFARSDEFISIMKSFGL